MRVCDYIASRLVDYGVKNIYGIMGGGAAGLNDGFILNKNLNYVCFHHEQGAANAALAESKITNKFTVVNPTTGCGGLNCLTPLVSAFQDSNPMLFISGNFRMKYTTNYVNKEKNISLRKLGIQEHNIIESVKSSCKFSHFIDSADEVPYILEKAISISMSGRKGPCWIDIPSDIQVADIDVENISKELYQIENTSYFSSIYNDVSELINLLSIHERPLILAGYGIHLSNTRSEFIDFINRYNLPFVTTFLTKDLIPYSHPMNMGIIGIKGNRAANFALQNCDLLVVLGSSLVLAHIGYDPNLFSPKSKKIFINIDENDYLSSNIIFDKFVKCDLKDFFDYASL